MLRRWLEAGLDASVVTVIRPSGAAPAPGVRTLARLPSGEKPPRIMLLGVKPQKLDEVARDVAAAIGRETLLLSILAGTEIAALRQRFPAAGAVVRAMPNTPVTLGRGVTLLHGDAGQFKAELKTLVAPLGLAEWIDNEAQFVVASALTASGPAFVFRFIAALAGAAVELGLDEAQSIRLASAMVDGAAGLALAAGEHPGQLADRVASAGGMTRKGLDVLDEQDALIGLVTRTLLAAELRARELAAETR